MKPSVTGMNSAERYKSSLKETSFVSLGKILQTLSSAVSNGNIDNRASLEEAAVAGGSGRAVSQVLHERGEGALGA
jgi:hypothetical protein